MQQDSGRELLIANSDDEIGEQGQDNDVDEQGEGGPCIVLHEREYRTARHMALMETQITRRITSGNQQHQTKAQIQLFEAANSSSNHGNTVVKMINRQPISPFKSIHGVAVAAVVAEDLQDSPLDIGFIYKR